MAKHEITTELEELKEIIDSFKKVKDYHKLLNSLNDFVQKQATKAKRDYAVYCKSKKVKFLTQGEARLLKNKIGKTESVIMYKEFMGESN